MISIEECRKYFPTDWSDDQIMIYRDKIYWLAYFSFNIYTEIWEDKKE